MSTVPILNAADCPVNPTVISVNEIVPKLALNDIPVNPKPSSTVKDPTLDVILIPVGLATAPPNPTIEPRVVSIDKPETITVSFGTVIEPKVNVAAIPVKSASCEEDPIAVPCVKVIS